MSASYGLILSGSDYQSTESEAPSLATFLSQGAATGICVSFLSPVSGMLSHPENGYNYMLVWFLPWFLIGGMLFGLCEGAILWACAYLVGRRINSLVRGVIGAGAFYLLIHAYVFLFEEHAPTNESLAEHLRVIGLKVGCGVVLGLVIGSRFRPFYELVRGSTRAPVISGMTGLLLRIVVIFSLMVSILNLILSLQWDFNRIEFIFAAAALLHFAAAVAIVFPRMPFWLLLPLALIINIPIAIYVVDVLKPDEFGTRTLMLNYLALWAAFLSCRVKVPRRPFNFLKREPTLPPDRLGEGL